MTTVQATWATMGVLAVLGSAMADEPLPTREQLIAWGTETLAQIQRELRVPATGLYSDEAHLDGRRSGPAFTWGCGVMLPALNAAAKLDPAVKPELESYAKALEVYWNTTGPTPGFDVLPCPKPVDRYYDDNAWLVLAYAEAFEVTGNAAWLERAKLTLNYVLSGYDDRLGGGLYWREMPRDSKNTCTNAPAVVCCYRLARLTGDAQLKARGDAILDWTLAHLRDPEDGLMWDNIKLDGKVDKAKFSYNTALTLRALADPSRDAASLEQAVVTARRAVAKWRDAETGAFRDDACFAHLLAEALLYLDERTGRDEFRPAVLQALGFLHARNRDANGHYASHWNTVATKPYEGWKLIAEASAVRGYLLAALALALR